MLSSIELNELFDRLGTPPKGRRLVEKARREAPVRKVQSNSGNVITLFQSNKMDREIATESRTVEYPAVVQYERNVLIREYYPQPCRIDIILTDGGRIKASRIQHVPDYLVIQNDQICLEEWKTEARLSSLAKKYPGRIVKEDDGWHYPEVEEQLKEFGITYRIRSGDEHPHQYVSNIIFLAGYYHPSCLPIDEGKLDFIRAVFADRPVANLTEFLPIVNLNGANVADKLNTEEVADGSLIITGDDIYKAIADGQVIFDLLNEDISNTHTAKVYRDEISLKFYQKMYSTVDIDYNYRLDSSIEIGAEVDYEGTRYKIELVGKKSVILMGDEGSTEISLDLLEKQHANGKLIIRSIKDKISNIIEDSEDKIKSKYLAIGLARSERLENAELDPKSLTNSQKRTLQRYRKKMREAGDSLTEQLKALVPSWGNCGKTRKISVELISLIKSLVEKKFNTPTNIKKNMAYKIFISACNEAGLNPCSQATFNIEVDVNKSDRARRGKRFVYQNEAIVWYLKVDEPIHGVRPFQCVHIDHTPLDLLVRLPKCKKNKKVILTLATDAESRRVVGFYLSFEPASYRSCMMVLRDIVRRHGRMPEMIIVDYGKEFQSNAFKAACKDYGCHVRYRPKAQPRHGSVLERLFGTVNSELIHNLNGNTQLMKYLRTVTKSISPENFVEWTLPALHGALDYFFEVLYGTENHPAHGEEPVKHFAERMIETGMRLHRLVCMDRTFRIKTCPPVDMTGTRIVDYQRGVKVSHIWYWADAFRDIKLDGKPVEVRIDPWDVRVVYALVKDVWHQCISKLAMRLRQYTEIELRYAFEEMEKTEGVKKKDLSPERVAEWMKVLDARNFDPRLREEQSEARIIYEPLGMTVVEAVVGQSNNNDPASVQTSGGPGLPDGKIDPLSAIPIQIDDWEEYGLF